MNRRPLPPLRLVYSRPLPNLQPVHNELAKKRARGYPSAIRDMSDNLDLLGDKLAALLAHFGPRHRVRPPDDAA